jgi:hypothetical protein
LQAKTGAIMTVETKFPLTRQELAEIGGKQVTLKEIYSHLAK